MKRRGTSIAIAGALAVVLSLFGSTGASAHERREVGNYVFVVGFQNEPAYVEQLNGASVTIFTKDGKAVDGADKTLKVEVGTGGQTRMLDLKKDVAKQGAYVAAFIPTKTGTYTFRFVGTIDTQNINETFQSGPNRFDDVVSAADVQFPVKVPSVGELAAQVQGAKTDAAAAPATSAPAAPASSADTQRALDRADSARSLALGLGIGGIVVGLAGLIVAFLALRARGASAGPRTTGGRAEPI